MYAKDLPKNKEEIVAWALEYAPSFTWKQLEDNDDIVLNTNLITDWVCRIAEQFPELIVLSCTDKNTPRILVADIQVCGGIIPAITVKQYLQNKGIDIKIVGPWKDFTEVLFD